MSGVFYSASFNAVFLATLLAISHGMLKWASVNSDGTFWGLLRQWWWLLFLAISIYVFIFGYYTYILKYVQLNKLYPMYTGLSILLVFALGAIFFAEGVSTLKIIGCVFVVSGVLLLSWS